MAGFTHVNLKQVENMAARHGMTGMSSHFASRPLGLERQGLSLFVLEPGFRMPFGHRHAEQEEVYVVVSGAARMRLGDEIVVLGPFDAVRVPPETWRGIEAGPEGAEVLVAGAPALDAPDHEMDRAWWTD